LVKRGKFFSIFAVLTLLILLAPAVISAPGQNVAQATEEEVTQELNATFSFSESSPAGAWWTFTAGSPTIQSPGLCLEQYTRPYVLRSTSSPLAGCGFRNYTTGSGNVVGNLNGTMDLSWNTFNFSQKYSAGPLYHDYGSSAHFGWMAGRGHYYEQGNTSNNFTFVFVLDFDSDPDITNAVGKGFMVSVEENGIFGNMANPVQDRHKIIGDFEVSKSSSAYTWNLHLRNYDPSEVYYKGDTTVVGGVLQELTDDIHAPLALVNFTQNGPEVTPSDATTDFEEIAWGKDPIKNITGGPLGANGTMGITRNGALYLTTPSGHVHIQAAEACILHINDTYAQTLDDGSTYGHMYYYLLLSLPYQDLPIGEMFSQDGYTFYPFGMYLNPTDCYVGAETFALAHIEIESKIGTANQTSTDLSYGLYPHPKVEKVFPSNGFQGTTMNVKIKGKYFLRAAGEKSGWVANSGSVDFGPNITVNSYIVNSAEQITANITIAPSASASTEVVNVTSCFGYANGSGTDPYLSGVKAGGFNIVTEGSTLQGQVSFVGRSTPSDRWIEPFEVKAFEPGNLNNEIWNGTATTNDTGVFTMSGLLPETYDIGIKNATCLSELVTNVTLNSTAVANFGNREGDVKKTDKVDGFDFALLSGAYNTMPGAAKWNPNADLNRSGKVDGFDFALLSGNYNKLGSGFGYFVGF